MPRDESGSASEGSGRADWRRGGSAQSRGGRPASKQGSGWTVKKDRQYERAAQRYRIKIAAWSLLFLLLVAAFVVYVFWRPRKPPLVVATVAEYEAPLPPNAWASEDARRLATLDSEKERRKIVTHVSVSGDSKQALLAELQRSLDQARPGGPDKNVVILYLSLHGVVDGAGEPCLLPPGVSPLASDQWWRVSDLLKELFSAEAVTRRGANVKTLLILDANRLDANWNMGLLYNGFADRLQAVFEQANVRNLYLLNSAGPGQIGWAAPELEGSAFAYFLCQGLEGAADMEHGNSDETVSLRELYTYLRDKVGRWVREKRDDDQRPMLLPADADFPLVYADARSETTLPDPTETTDPRWQIIAGLWQQHAELQQQAPYRRYPLQWEQVQRGLLRLEQLVQAGETYRAAFDKELGVARSRLASLQRSLAAPATVDLATYSLPLAHRFETWPDPAEASVGLQHFLKPPQGADSPNDTSKADVPAAAATPPENNNPAENAPPKDAAPEDSKSDAGSEPSAATPESQATAEGAAEASDEKAASKDSQDKSAQPAESTKPEPKPDQRYGYLASAAATWQWSLGEATRPDLGKALQFLDRERRRRPADLTEVHFLRMLHAYLPPHVWAEDPYLVRLALRTRDLAEEAAAPVELRTHYWIHTPVEQADTKRRLAEDTLFVGQKQALSETERTLNVLIAETGPYCQASRLADTMAEAFQLRDRAWARVPYLAKWQMARLRRSGTSNAALQEVIAGTHQLGKDLDELLPRGQWPQPQQTAAAELQRKLASLEDTFQSECRAVGGAGEDRQTLRAITCLLSVPLVTGAQRNELRRKSLRIVRAMGAADADYRGASTEGSPDQTAAEASAAGSPYLQRLIQWKTQPPLQILGRAALGRQDKTFSAGEPWQMLSAQGEEVRRLLSTVSETAQQAMSESDTALQDESEPQLAAARAGYSRADRLTRAAAAMLDDRLQAALRRDPIEVLWKFDAHRLLLWQARRTIEDFWGPNPGRGTPFFEIAAADYVKSARALCPADLSLKQASDTTSTLLAHRQAAAREGIQPKVAPSHLFFDEEAPSVQLNLTVTPASDLPKGEAAVYLQGVQGAPFPLWTAAQQENSDPQRLDYAVSAGGTAAKPSYWIPVADLSGGASDLQAVTLYRGHLRSADFYVHPARALELTYQRPQYPRPTIIVNGDARQRSSVMFILDYSISMDVDLVVEGQKKKRFEVARDALDDILERLIGPEQRYRAGLLVYGHRAGWNPNDTRQIRSWDPQRPGRTIDQPPEEAKLHPSDDVELIMPMGRFGDFEREEVNEKLAKLKPLGETPLYLAIMEAIGHLRGEEETRKRHIVVITDGVNWQSKGGRKGRKFPEDVRDALALPANRDIRLDVVGFGLTDEDLQLQVQRIRDPRTRQERLKTLRKDFADLKALANAFYPASNPISLAKALEKSLGLSQYIVETLPGGQPVTPEPLDLNTVCTAIKRPLGKPDAYRVRLADPERPAEAEVVVEGGEALQLWLEDGDSRQLVHHRWDTELRDSCDRVPAPSDRQGRSFFIGAHLPRWVERPEWQRRGAEFYLSVQNADAQRFSPRPAEAWIQVKADLPGERPEAETVYSFFDVRYEPGYPVPMLSCLVPNWPKEAKTALLRLCCKLNKTTPDKVVRLGVFPPGDFRLGTVPEITFRLQRDPSADSRRVTLIERGPLRSDHLPIKVEIVPAAEQVTRRFHFDPHAETKTVRHTFTYADATAAEIRDYEVLFTTGEKLVEGAIAAPRPLEVTLPRD